MRAAKYKHYSAGNENGIKNTEVKANTVKGAPKKLKALSCATAFLLASACFIIPTTTLAPSADAFEDSKAEAFSVGDIDSFASLITDNCIAEAITAATTFEETTAETEETAEETAEETEETTTEAETEETTAETEQPATETTATAATAAATAAATQPATEAAEVSSVISQEGYLISISNPDASYSPSKVTLSDYDRAKLERLVMGEAGSLGFTGSALVAQAIRDAMNRSGTSSIDTIISEYQYVGSTEIEPTDDVLRAVSYIFDENGSVVRHRVLCFYTGTSNWHETQQYVTSFGNVRFFDLTTA